LGFAFFTAFFFAIRCCGGDLATTPAARSKRSHASGCNSISLAGAFAMKKIRLQPAKFRQTYLTLMEEVIRRRNIVADVMENKFNLPLAIAYELCYLQLRIICESIALGCLAAHGGIPAARAKNVQNTWRAPDILNELERLHPDFYPVPGDYLTLDPEGAPENISLIKSGYLTRAELVKLWKESGGALHRGTMKDIERGYDFRKFDKIKAWDEKILRLLKYHQITLVNRTFLFSIIMQHPADGRVRAFLPKRV
jgi:hypothetical protein